MKQFMDEEFLLSTDTARRLYHEFAEPLPIVDYHCHIDAREIFEDRRFENITQAWLGSDHYKWRQMRAAGVPEERITGSGSDREKFLAWAKTLEMAVGNPLYHWSHLELRRYFDYKGYLNEKTADQVWELTRERLREPAMSARGLLVKSGVRLLCTTDDPADSLEYHRRLAEDPGFPVRVLPAWRPDKAMGLDQPDYPDYLKRLEAAAGREIRDFSSLMEALEKRMDAFAALGCVTADHGLSAVPFTEALEKEVETIFSWRLSGRIPDKRELAAFQTAFLAVMGREYCRRGWVMQLHFGVKRNNSSRLYSLLGPDAGADCILSPVRLALLADFLNALDRTGELPKTVLYSLNPSDNAAVGTLAGCFPGDGTLGKVCQGSAWWFNDHKEGMETQLKSWASLGLLGNFIGMLTDSRSFLSYPRHEYFRRIFCGLLGDWVEKGEYPADWDALLRIVRGVSLENAVRYFGFALEKPEVKGA